MDQSRISVRTKLTPMFDSIFSSPPSTVGSDSKGSTKWIWVPKPEQVPSTDGSHRVRSCAPTMDWATPEEVARVTDGGEALQGPLSEADEQAASNAARAACARWVEPMTAGRRPQRRKWMSSIHASSCRLSSPGSMDQYTSVRQPGSKSSAGVLV